MQLEVVREVVQVFRQSIDPLNNFMNQRLRALRELARGKKEWL